jgi:hypothetical protein
MLRVTALSLGYKKKWTKKGSLKTVGVTYFLELAQNSQTRTYHRNSPHVYKTLGSNNKAFMNFTFNMKTLKEHKTMVQKKSRVLVTGGAGFIGSHTVDKLVEADAEVTVLDNLDTGQMRNIARHEQNRNFHFVKGDIRDLSIVKKLVKDVDAVFNLAAIASVQRSVEDPLLVNDVNVKGTLNLLKASVDGDVKRFIQASSAAF